VKAPPFSRKHIAITVVVTILSVLSGCTDTQPDVTCVAYNEDNPPSFRCLRVFTDTKPIGGYSYGGVQTGDWEVQVCTDTRSCVITPGTTAPPHNRAYPNTSFRRCVADTRENRMVDAWCIDAERVQFDTRTRTGTLNMLDDCMYSTEYCALHALGPHNPYLVL